MTSAPEWNLPLISQALAWVSVEGAPALPPDLAGDAGYMMPPIAGAGEHGTWIAVSDEEINYAMGSLVSTLLNLVPVVGNAKGGWEFFTGKDVVTGHQLPWWERTVGLISALSPPWAEEAPAAIRVGIAVAEMSRTAKVIDVVDKGYKILNVARIDPAVLGSVFAEASATLQTGVDVDTLDWRRETTAMIHAGVLEAARVTAGIQEKQGLSPDTASQLNDILVRVFVRQAQADGLLPRRLQVTATMAEGGAAGETIDVWDPMTGVAWDITPAGNEAAAGEQVGRAITGSGGASVTITQVVTVTRP